LAITSASATELKWLTDLSKAMAQAKTENKAVLVLFTGSDWGDICARMDIEVFQSASFSDYAKNKLVLVQVDFPHAKPQSDILKRTNAQLKAKYKVEGIPTTLVLDAKGTVLGQHLGYSAGAGPKSVMDRIDRWLKKQSTAPRPAS